MWCHFRRRQSCYERDANYAMWPQSPPTPKLKIMNFSGNVTWHRAVTANVTSMTSWSQECCQDLPNGNWTWHRGQNNRYCVWIPWSSYNTTLYTTGLSFNHRLNVVKFSNVSGTSKTDNCAEMMPPGVSDDFVIQTQHYEVFQPV